MANRYHSEVHPDKQRVSKKIEVLMHENVPQKQAVAMAINMEKHHRLTNYGGYIRVKKK